jgi:hypothetical protein
MGGCFFYLAEVWTGLKGLSRVLSLLMSPFLGNQVRLKGLLRVMPLSSSVLVPILHYATYSLALAQGIKDQNIYDPFGVINTPISFLLFRDLALLFFIWVWVYVGELTPLNLLVPCNPSHF